MIEEINISEIKENPENPRIITKEKFELLKKSIQDFPDMLKIRPLVVDGEKFNTIDEFDGYLFSESGVVISTRKGIKEIYGSPDKDGYLKITLVNKSGGFEYFRKHRLILWAFKGKSDLEGNHIDSNKLNNSISNLEYLTLQENQCHRRLHEGYSVGVCWDKKSKKFRAYLQHNKIWEHLGFYELKEDAKRAYLKRLTELNIINKYAEEN